MAENRIERGEVIRFPGTKEAAASPPTFVHLRVHSAFSLLEGAIPVKDLPTLCRANGMPAVAVTDTGNLFGAVEIAQVLADKGLQPIMGCQLAVDLGEDDTRSLKAGGQAASRRDPSYLVLLVQNETGWRHLSKLVSRSFLGVGPAEPPHVKLADLEGMAEGLICLTGGPSGAINALVAAGQGDAARRHLENLARIFKNRLYVELQRHGAQEEIDTEGWLVDAAYALGLPLVATNEPFFAREDLFEAHDALLCIGTGSYVSQADRRRVTPEHFFKSAGQMAELFEDLPEAIANTVEIARRCAYIPRKRDPILPRFDLPGGRSAAEELRLQAEDGLRKRLAASGLFAPEDDYWKRLDYELSVITGIGFEGYFLIVSDFMKWTRAQGIPVGVRGSGATSIVAWALEITALDPLRFKLVFERFLNPERKSMPDFDIDFCQERREEVIRYVKERYGADRVAHIITFGTLQARAAVRDVGRVLEMPYGQVDRISKMIPNPPGKQVRLREAIEAEPRLQDMEASEENVARLFDIVGKIEGLYRHASTHAAGIVIGDRPLEDLVPLYRDPRSDMPVTQFDYKNNEKVGLVKFDFLGLKTLTVIALTEKMLAARGIKVKSEEVGFEDRATFEMLSRGDSVGVFQLESSGMRDLIRKLKPDRIEDLIALVALYRPGPMQSIPKYIACKHGQEEPYYVHPALEPILRETYGVMTYQEDVMMIARELGGYSMGEADNLRRAMGKKDQAEMARNREIFTSRAETRGIPKAAAAEIFEQAEKFAGYGFNKGHAAAYAQVAYQTAYLKANYPAEFIAASMTLDIGATDRLNIFRQEAERLSIPVLPPSINESEATFAVAFDAAGKPAIRYALAAIRNVGRPAMDHLVEVRASGRPFRSLFDFARRVDPRHVSKRALESLAAAGAFDGLNPNRAQVMAGAETLIAHANGTARERGAGQSSLFGDAGASLSDPPLPQTLPWSEAERLQREFDAIGFYLSGHPIDSAMTALRRAGVRPFGEFLKEAKRETAIVMLAGTVLARQDRKSRERDTPYAFVTFSDPSGVFEAIVFSDTLRLAGSHLQVGAPVVINAIAEWQNDDVKLRIQNVRPLDEVTAETGTGLRVFVNESAGLPALAARLVRPGKGQVIVTAMLGEGLEVDIELPGRYGITRELRDAIKSAPGVLEVEEV
ncbi:MAG: DNA polymerase III subunit alpha [Alphaproteobacteria bacterium]|nr:DNA polymerase III subunit alpha [Alphaproteobacteria bacterium]